MKEVGYKLTVISDDVELKDDGVTRIKGVSYREIPKLEDESIDLCLLDTDHNYWTMREELLALYPKLSYGGILIIHDVDTFYYASGLALSYADGSSYPLDQINVCTKAHGGMSMAVLDFLTNMKTAMMLKAWLPMDNGICLIRKNAKETEFLTHKSAFDGAGNRKT